MKFVNTAFNKNDTIITTITTTNDNNNLLLLYIHLQGNYFAK